jgi:hypothetical protein
MWLIKITLVFCFMFAILCSCQTVLAEPTNPPPSDSKNHVITPEELFRPQYVDRPWSVLLYAGITAYENIGEVITFHITPTGESIYSAELAYIFYRNLFSEFQVAVNGAMRFASGENPVPEFDVYIMYRLIKFPWSKYIDTTMAVGEGLSYAASIPYSEQKKDVNSEELLDFLTFELTLGLPSHPEWQLVGRIHHRSGMYGIFAPRSYHAGSNAAGLGIRYFF